MMSKLPHLARPTTSVAASAASPSSAAFIPPWVQPPLALALPHEPPALACTEEFRMQLIAGLMSRFAPSRLRPSEKYLNDSA